LSIALSLVRVLPDWYAPSPSATVVDGRHAATATERKYRVIAAYRAKLVLCTQRHRSHTGSVSARESTQRGRPSQAAWRPAAAGARRGRADPGRHRPRG